MVKLNRSIGEIPNYKAFVMAENDMFPTINEGDHLVVDIEQRFIRSGNIYVTDDKKSIIVCRLLLDMDDELASAITILGRVIGLKG
tara:strand:- start:145675 stop:145932 length:258 start_codon:yes stop_codon:yes gene_type:complete